MAGKGSVTIKIDGDASDFKKEISIVEKSAKSAAAQLAQEYKKAGADMSSAMKRAWEEVKTAQKNGTTVTINGVETIISKNEDIIDQKSALGGIYDHMGDSAQSAASKVSGLMTVAGRGLSGLGTVAKGVAKGATVVYGAVSAAMSVAGVASVKYNATIEQLQTSFATMTGSAEKAADVVERLRTMGAATPFEMADLASVTQMLMQYGFTADDALEKMRMLGDIAQGNSEAMNSIAMGYAQMSSAGKVNLQDIKQMINGGFNPLQEISERTGESMASLYDRISKGTMSVNEITESMRYATSEGGKFFQSMEKQSQTLNGQLSTLKDNLSSFGGELFRPMTDLMRTTLLPEANALLAEFQAAYQKNGIDGLMNAFNAQIPSLLNAGSAALQKLFAGINKQLPGLMKSLLSNVPSLLSSAVDLVPQIADSLFTVAASAVEILVGKLPELIPTLVKGIGSLAKSIAFGIDDMIAGIFDGIEQAAHEGQVKIAGVWVDEENTKKYTFKLDTDVSPATSAIETAYSTIRTALQTDLLTDDQRAEIEGMIGEDYDAIYNKLIEFGLSEPQADELATNISGASDTITEKLRALDVGADAGTILKWMVQAKGSNLALKHYAREAGLDDGDINEIIGVYNEANGRLQNETPSVAQTIYETLTDGLADTDAVKSDLKDKVQKSAEDMLKEAEEGYKAAVAQLDTSAPDYQQRLQELQTEYETTKAEIISIRDDSLVIIDTLAGQTTAQVEASFDLIAELERRMNGVQIRIAELSDEAKSLGEAQFRVVRSGAQADEETISGAISFKISEFRLDEQSAKDAYDAAIEELNMKFGKGEISKAEYDAGVQDAQATRDAAVQQAQDAFDKAFAEIIKGIAKSEGNEAAMDAALKAMGTGNLIDSVIATLAEGGEVDQATLSSLSEQLGSALGEAFDPGLLAEYAKIAASGGDWSLFTGMLEDYAHQIDGMQMDSLQQALGGKIGEAWAKALDDGFLTGTDFDVSSTEEQLAAIFNAMNLQPVGADVIAGMGEGMANADLSTDAARVEINTENALRSAFNSHSPAQTMVPIGSDVAAGVGQGMSEYDFSGDAETMAQSAKSAAATAMNGSGINAGKMFSAGIATGILSGRSGVISAAISVARAAVAAMRSALQINSPSRVTAEIGRYTGEGFEIGLTESLNAAIRSAQNVVGSMNLTPRLTAPDLSSAFASAAGSIADAEGSRPIYLNVNGRTLASVTAADTRRAQNSYNRSIALGVGK